MLDRSLVKQAGQLISAIKTEVIESENYPDILSLLEKELILQKYINERISLSVMEELIYYSNKYSTVKTIESAKEKFRNILDRSIFSRTEAQQRQIEGLFRDRNLRKRSSDDSFLHTVHYNILYNWKNGSENDWEKEYRFTRKNYNLLLTNPEKIKYFPELSIQLFYNYLIAVSISGRA